MSRDSFGYTHASKGTQPSASLDFEANERPKEQHFDWFWFNVIAAINGHASEFDRLDSNNDGKVDAADQADHADTADDADTLDGVQLADIDWAHLALAQSDIDVSDLGPADSDLDMNGNNIENTGGVVLPVGTDEYVTQ